MRVFIFTNVPLDAINDLEIFNYLPDKLARRIRDVFHTFDEISVHQNEGFSRILVSCRGKIRNCSGSTGNC